MTREEISQAAEDYAKNYGYFNCDTGDVFLAFEDGAKWALSNMWHSIDKGDLPKSDGRYLILMRNGYPCVVEYKDKFWKVLGYQSDVKYWMEIPEIKEEEK